MSTTKKPAVQVAASKKAAKLKADARPQHQWLRNLSRELPPLRDKPSPSAPERVGPAHRSQGPSRLLDKHEVCAIAGASYPSIWSWMRNNTFPRSRIVGGRSMWLSTEVEAWLAALPLRPLKGDPSETSGR
jgi:predicted DNA-binding transcriptional regulator AlpA